MKGRLTGLQLARIRADEAGRVAAAYREQVASRLAVMRASRLDPVLHAAARMEVSAAKLQHDAALLLLARANSAVHKLEQAGYPMPPEPRGRPAVLCHGGHMCGQPAGCRRNLQCTPAPAPAPGPAPRTPAPHV